MVLLSLAVEVEAGAVAGLFGGRTIVVGGEEIVFESYLHVVVE